jgi:hypothetical protein
LSLILAIALKPLKCGIVKKAAVFAARMASFSARSAVRTARIGPPGGAWAPYRLMSALLNGRSQANALPPTSRKISASFLYNGTRSHFEENGFSYVRSKGKNTA